MTTNEIQKEYALKGHVKVNWNKNLNNTIVGALPHPINDRNDKRLGDYSKYNLVWINPDTSEVITKFELLKPDHPEWNKDMLVLDLKSKKKLNFLLKELENGYVFDDDDINLLNGKIKYDPVTHYLGDKDIFEYSNGKFLAYSKSIDRANRLTYKIYKPEKDANGEWYCRIIPSRCRGHYLDDITYDMKNANKSANSLGGTLDEETIAKIRNASGNSLINRMFSMGIGLIPRL